MSETNDAASRPDSAAPDVAARTRDLMHDPAWRAARRRSRKRLLILLGLAMVLGSGLYMWWRQFGPGQGEPDTEEGRGWEAYHRGDYRAAVAHFDAALRRNPRSADAYTGRAWVRVLQRDWEPALADSAEALRLDPDSAMAHTARANALAGTGKVREALADLDEAIRRKPDYARAYYDRARLRFSQSAKTAEPLADLNEAIRLNPDYAPALTLRGLVLYTARRYAEAVDSCTRALTIDRGDATAYLYRGLARRAMGEARAAQADIDHALSLDPNLRAVLGEAETAPKR